MQYKCDVCYDRELEVVQRQTLVFCYYYSYLEHLMYILGCDKHSCLLTELTLLKLINPFKATTEVLFSAALCRQGN